MNCKYLWALKILEENLIADIIVTDLIPGLNPYLTEEDKEYIKHEKFNERKTTKLLDILSEKDDKCFDCFLDTLKTTNKELYNKLNSILSDNEIVRERQFNMDEILSKGDVPVSTENYVTRQELENEILKIIQLNSRKPILIHGIIGSGKTKIISKILENKILFTKKFLNCCWMTIGNINESAIVIKLQILLKKLKFHKKRSEFPMSNIPEILVEDIKKQLSDGTTLLIIDDVRSSEVMKYLTFNEKYIVISIISNLFSRGSAEEVYISDIFNDEQCKELINKKCENPDNSIIEKIIQKSGNHPMYLDWICNLLKINEDSERLIDQLDFDKTMQISKQCIDILDESLQDYFIMLLIFSLDEWVTIELLAIYWSVPIGDAFQIIQKLCEHNLMKKMYNVDYNCNTYAVHNLYLNCLKNSIHQDKFEEYEEIMVQRFFKKYKTWISIDIYDSFFFNFYSIMLSRSKDFEKLTSLYCNYSFIAAKIAVCGINKSVDDYDILRPKEPDNKWIDFEEFMKKNTDNLNNLIENKSITIKIENIFTRLIQCGLHEMKESSTYKSASENRQFSKEKDFWDWINPTKSIKIWDNSKIKIVIKLVNINDHYILMYTTDSLVRLIELNSGNCLFKYKISDNPIILVKLHINMDISIIDSRAQFWFFNFDEFVSEKKTLLIYDEENNNQMDQLFSVKSNSQKYDSLKNSEKTLLDNLLKNCKKQLFNEEKLDNLQAEVFCNKIYIWNSEEANINYFIYDLKSNSETHFTIIGSIKKHVFSLDTLYYLHNDGIIKSYNESWKLKDIMNKKEGIIDFIVSGLDIFWVSTNTVFKNAEEFLCIKEPLNISKISSNNIDLLILYLSSGNVQIWYHPKKVLIHSLYDWQLKNVFFLNNSDNLITISETNVAKWKVGDLKETINYYPNQFIMKKSNSSLILVLQTTKNEIEIRKYDNGNITVNTEYKDSIATCFTCLHNFVFIGFKSGIFEVYNLMKSTKVYHRGTKILNFEIISLATYKIDENNIGILVHQSDNKIMTYSFNQKNLNIANFNLNLPKYVPRCKFFKIKDLLICGVYNDQTCTLYKIFDSAVCKIGYYDFGDNIMDFDISADVKYLCMISTNGLFKTWEINASNLLNSIKENYGILRKCKFRPRHDFNNWRLVAIINDKAQIYLYYFCGNKYQINLLVKEFSPTINQIPPTLEWSSDSLYLLVGDNAIKKWKIREKPHHKEHVKSACTILQTYFGGVQCLQVQEDFIATVDQQGFLCILKRLD